VSKKKKKQKNLSTNLAQKYLDIKANPEYASLAPLDTIITGRLMELVERVAKEDYPNRIEEFFKAWDDFKRTHPMIEQYFHTDSAKKAYNRLEELRDANFHDYEAWKQIIQLADEKRKLSESRMKILKDMKALMSADEVYELSAKLLASVTKVIDDPRIIQAIRYEFAKILGDGHIEEPPKGGGEVIDLEPSGMDRGQILHTGDAESPDLQGENIPPTVPEGHAGGGVQD
jgi:hypothetical protein